MYDFRGRSRAQRRPRGHGRTRAPGRARVPFGIPWGLPGEGGQGGEGNSWAGWGRAPALPRGAGPAPLLCAALAARAGPARGAARPLPSRPLPSPPVAGADAAAPAQLRPESSGGGARPWRRPGRAGRRRGQRWAGGGGSGGSGGPGPPGARPRGRGAAGPGRCQRGAAGGRAEAAGRRVWLRCLPALPALRPLPCPALPAPRCPAVPRGWDRASGSRGEARHAVLRAARGGSPWLHAVRVGVLMGWEAVEGNFQLLQELCFSIIGLSTPLICPQIVFSLRLPVSLQCNLSTNLLQCCLLSPLSALPNCAGREGRGGQQQQQLWVLSHRTGTAEICSSVKVCVYLTCTTISKLHLF